MIVDCDGAACPEGTMEGDIIVLKFGDSVLRGPGDVPAAVHEIYRWYRAGWRVVAIAGPSGEQRAASLLGIELERAGIPARLIDAEGIDPPVPADYIDQLQTLLDYTPVLVIADLGHGTDDRSAVYLANVLRASRCRLLKDMDGVYEADFSDGGWSASPVELQRFSALGYADALDRSSSQPATPPPTSVLILSCDELGVNIFKSVAAMPEHFRVIGIFTPEGVARSAEVPHDVQLYVSLESTMGLRPDVVVDTLLGLEPAHSLDSHFLERGASVVSANLPLIADAGRKLNTLAARCSTYLRYDAAVGGSAPMLEALRRETHVGEIRAIAAVFGGEASRILDRCSKGFGLEDLIQNALAELGQIALHEEMSGIRSARKLCVLARHAFGHDPDAFRVDAFDAKSLARARDSLTENCTLRLVARAWKISHRVFGQLQMEALDTRDPLAQVQPEWNRLVITHRQGRKDHERQVVVQGRDGRWPTAEALMADLLDVRFAHLALSKPMPRTAP
jgi:homoserine dehydrogenase